MLRVLLAVHILAAVIFLGNIITAAFWKTRADRSRNWEVMALTDRAVMLADFVFTGPGVAVVLVTGIWMVGLTGWERFQEPWLSASLILLILTGVIWLGALMPLQVRMARMSRDAARTGQADPLYARASRTWAIFGGVATLMPVVILFLMVLKPD